MGIPVITVANNKGGVSKTTTSVLLAEYLALVKGLRVLAIDFDQGNLSHVFQTCETFKGNRLPIKHPEYDSSDPVDIKIYNERSSIYDIYWGKGVLVYDTYVDGSEGAGGTVSVIASNTKLWEEIVQEWKDMKKPANYYSGSSNPNFSINAVIDHLGSFLDKNVHCCDDYDIIVIDSGPSTTPLLKAAISASTHVLVPYVGEEFSIIGIPEILRLILAANSRRFDRAKIDVLGLLPSNVISSNKTVKNNINATRLEFPQYHLPEGAVMYNRTSISRRMGLANQSPSSVFIKSTASDSGSPKVTKKDREMCLNVFDHIYKKISKDIKISKKSEELANG